MAATYYVIVTGTLAYSGSTVRLWAGVLLSDAGAIAAAQSANIVLGDGTDSILAAASARALAARNRGANEDVCNAIMLSAYSASAVSQAEHASLERASIAATSAATVMTGGYPAKRAGTMRQLYVAMGQTAFASGESVVLNIKKNGVSIGTKTLDSTVATGGIIDLSSQLTGQAVNAGDQFTCDETYTPGGTPAHPSYGVVAQWS